MSANPLILYLHGFLSSPQSKKAQQTLRYCQRIGLQGSIKVPWMRNGPAQTVDELRAIIESHHEGKVVLIGSSLGGYYATFLAEEYGFPAVLINPAVRPFELWESHLGEHRNYYSGEVHLVTEQHIEELRELEKSRLNNPDNYLLLVQTGDETLDYRQALEKFASAHCMVRENGSHSYEGFEQELPTIFDFLLSRID